MAADDARSMPLQNFNVILTQHNPARDKNVHFIVQPKMTAKDRQLIAQRKVCSSFVAEARLSSCFAVYEAVGTTLLGRMFDILHD